MVYYHVYWTRGFLRSRHPLISPTVLCPPAPAPQKATAPAKATNRRAPHALKSISSTETNRLGLKLLREVWQKTRLYENFCSLLFGDIFVHFLVGIMTGKSWKEMHDPLIILLFFCGNRWPPHRPHPSCKKFPLCSVFHDFFPATQNEQPETRNQMNFKCSNWSNIISIRYHLPPILKHVLVPLVEPAWLWDYDIFLSY